MKGKYISGKNIENIIPILKKQLESIELAMKDTDNNNKDAQNWLGNNRNLIMGIISDLER